MGYQMPNFNENIEIHAFFESKGQVFSWGVTEIAGKKVLSKGFHTLKFFGEIIRGTNEFFRHLLLVLILTAHCEVNTKVTILDSEQFYSVIKDLENLVILFSDF